MDFSEALKEIKKGNRAFRQEWGKYKYLFILDGDMVPRSAIRDQALRDNTDPTKDHVQMMPTIRYVLQNDAVGTGWTPTNEDLFAEDWETL